MLEVPVITGTQLCSMMRQHGCTMRDLAGKTGITLRRIRRARQIGLFEANAARDWIQAITGADPGVLRAQSTPRACGVRELTTNQLWVLEHLRDAGADWIAEAAEKCWTHGQRYYIDSRIGCGGFVRQRFEEGNREAVRQG